MKIKCVISRGAPKPVWLLLDDESADEWWARVAKSTLEHLAVPDALDRPAEFYVQNADTTKQVTVRFLEPEPLIYSANQPFF